MKKIITILALLVVTTVMFTATAQDATIKKAGSAGFFLATQTAKVAAYNYVIKLEDFPAPYYYTYAVKLIDNTGSNTASVVLAGSLDNTYYKTITTVAYTGNGADTTIIGNITGSPLSYRYLRFTVTPTDTMWVKSIFLNALPIN